MKKIMKYPPLEGLCKECKYKCFRCEDINFRGVKECKYVKAPREQIKEILGVQERIKL